MSELKRSLEGALCFSAAELDAWVTEDAVRAPAHAALSAQPGSSEPHTHKSLKQGARWHSGST